MTELFDTSVEIGVCRGNTRGSSVFDVHIEFVECFPCFRRNGFSNGSRVFTSHADRRQDRIRIIAVKRQKMSHVFRRERSVVLFEIHLIARRADQWFPLFAACVIQEDVQRDIDESRKILGSLHIASHPVNRTPNATEHALNSWFLPWNTFN